MQESNRLYREKNKESISETKKLWYEKNKDNVNERRVEAYYNAQREIVECECDGSYTLMDGKTNLMEGHYKTERHIQ